jgi:hypothetical protein
VAWRKFGKKYSLKNPKSIKGKIRKEKESVTEKRNQRQLLWFQKGGALNFITPVRGSTFRVHSLEAKTRAKRKDTSGGRSLFAAICQE